MKLASVALLVGVLCLAFPAHACWMAFLSESLCPAPPPAAPRAETIPPIPYELSKKTPNFPDRPGMANGQCKCWGRHCYPLSLGGCRKVQNLGIKCQRWGSQPTWCYQYDGPGWTSPSGCQTWAANRGSDWTPKCN
jgi:hypothetical protein